MASIALTLAPDARIIVATAFDRDAGGFPDEAVVRAVRFCRAIMDEDPALDARRLVTLLSLGGHDGAHDGRSAFERDLSALADQPIVVAAGNDGGRPVHAGGRLLADERAEVTLRVPRPTIDDARVALSLHVRTGRGFSFDGTSLREMAAGTRRVGDVLVTLEPGDDPDVVRVVLTAPEGHTLEAGRHTLAFDGPGEFDLWLAETRLGTPFLPAALDGPWLSETSVTLPATAPALIAVGASDRESEGLVASYSSVGPTAAGALVPDLVAPGGWMDVALSADLDASDPANLVGGRPAPNADGRVAIRGTSAAAAVVAGALLLALEADPTLGPEARERLVASVDGAGWSPARGWGELDVPALVQHPLAEREFRAAYGAPLVPSDRELHVGVRGRGALRIQVGQTTRDVVLRSGSAQVAFPIRESFPLAPPAVGSAVEVGLWIDGRALRPLEVPVVVDRTRAALPGGGGCAVAPAGAPDGGVVGALLLVLLGVRRARRGRTFSRRRRFRPAPRGRG